MRARQRPGYSSSAACSCHRCWVEQADQRAWCSSGEGPGPLIVSEDDQQLEGVVCHWAALAGRRRASASRCLGQHPLDPLALAREPRCPSEDGQRDQSPGHHE